MCDKWTSLSFSIIFHSCSLLLLAHYQVASDCNFLSMQTMQNLSKILKHPKLCLGWFSEWFSEWISEWFSSITRLAFGNHPSGWLWLVRRVKGDKTFETFWNFFNWYELFCETDRVFNFCMPLIFITLFCTNGLLILIYRTTFKI